MSKKILIEGTHSQYMKSAAEEIDLLQRGNVEEIRNHFYVYSLNSPEAQRLLVETDNKELILLHHEFHPVAWHKDIRRLLEEKGYIPPQDDSPEYTARMHKVFRTWMAVNLYYSNKSFPNVVMGALSDQLLASGDTDIPPRLSEEYELRLLDSGNWEKIRRYGRVHHWRPRARLKFIKLGNIRALFLYLQYFKFYGDEEETALIELGCSPLTWLYTSYYHIGKAARNLIKASGNPYIWKQVVLLEYMYEQPYIKKFGSIRNWEKQLSKSFDKKYFRHIP